MEQYPGSHHIYYSNQKTSAGHGQIEVSIDRMTEYPDKDGITERFTLSITVFLFMVFSNAKP